MQLFDRDFWLEIFDSVRRHKLRTFLTAFGVFWGIFMLVNLLAAGNGLRNGSKASMGKLTNSVHIWSGRPTSIPYKGLIKGRYIRMNDGDIEAIKQMDDIDVVAPNNGIGDHFVSRGVKGDTFTISGIWPIELDVKGYRLIEGRFLNQLDLLERRKTVVIGERVREILFDKDEQAIGGLIKMWGVPFQVVGVIAPSALNDWAQRDLNRVYMSQYTLRKTFNQRNDVHVIMVTPKKGVHAAVVEARVIRLLKERHRIHPDDNGVIGSWNAQKNFERVEGLFSGIKLFSWFVAIGTIIAGVVGVGNIMLITVKERTKEIGLRKAIGATPVSIISSIVQEALVITFFAGYLGLVVGVLTVELTSKFAQSANSTFMNPEISFSTAILAIGVLLVAGALASILPARKAARVNPVIALQDE
ncbi:ABC transporter permease [Teredinibacter haidensis]|uniref:ABC transporter permease n=1 Tax=Teredinibacter haidensis TaxID=2731755 RepID=UPI000948EEE8|nr:ABC transporter permease [Teredinibacter haidensis]